MLWAHWLPLSLFQWKQERHHCVNNAQTINFIKKIQEINTSRVVIFQRTFYTAIFVVPFFFLFLPKFGNFINIYYFHLLFFSLYLWFTVFDMASIVKSAAQMRNCYYYVWTKNNWDYFRFMLNRKFNTIWGRLRRKLALFESAVTRYICQNMLSAPVVNRTHCVEFVTCSRCRRRNVFSSKSLKFSRSLES